MVFGEGLKSLPLPSQTQKKTAEKGWYTFAGILSSGEILDEEKWLDSLDSLSWNFPGYLWDQTTYLSFFHTSIFAFQEGLVLSCDFLCNLLLLSFSSKWLDLVYCRTATHFVVPRPAIKLWAIAKLSRYPCHPPFVTHLRFPCLASEESCEAVSDTERRVLPRSQIWGRHFLLDRCFCSE